MRFPDRSGRILLLLMLGALAIRLLAVASRGMIQLDETAYVSMAQNLAAGRGPLDITGLTSTYFSPLLPILIAAAGVVTGDYVTAGYLTVSVFGALMLLPVYLLAREFVSRRAALQAAALTAVMPLFVDYASTVYGESVYTFFLLMSVYYAWRLLAASGAAADGAFAGGMRRRLAPAALAGLSLGLAYLANPAALFYLVAFMALAAAVAAFRRKAWRQTAAGAGIMVACFSLFAIPYIAFLHAELDRWTYSGKYADVNLYDASHNLRLGTIEWERDLLSLTQDEKDVKVNTLANDVDLLSFIVKHPGTAARIFADQSNVLYSDLLPAIAPLWLLPLMGPGLFRRRWDRPEAARSGYLLLMMAPALLVLAMYAHGRFFLPYMALATIWLGAGWQRLEEWGRHTAELCCPPPWKDRLTALAPWLIGAAVILPTLAYAGGDIYRQSEATQFKEAGEWLRQNAGEGQRIMSSESPSAFYSGGIPVFLPYAEYDAMTRYAAYQDIDYMVISKRTLLEWRPQLSLLLGGDESGHPEWRLVHKVRPDTPAETLVFEFAAGNDRISGDA